MATEPRRTPRSAAVLPAALLTLIAALCLGCAAGSADGTDTSWRFAIEEPVGSVQWQYATEFARRIEAASEGRIEVQVFPYGSLGTSDQVTELLRMGTLEFATASPGHLGKLIPEVQVLLLHHVLSSDAEVNRDALRDPELRGVFSSHYEEKGFRLLSIFQEGWQVWTTREPIRHPDDFDGVRMRVMTSPLLIEAYRAYGASPTPLPYGEVYSALQLRMIDGQVNPVFAIEEMSFFEVTDHMVFPRHLPFVTTVATAQAFFDGLDEAERQLVEQTVYDLQDFIFDVQSRTNRERLDEILERKPDMDIVRLTDEEIARFREASRPVRDSFVETVGPSGRQILDALLRAVEREEARRRVQTPSEEGSAADPSPAAD